MNSPETCFNKYVDMGYKLNPKWTIYDNISDQKRLLMASKERFFENSSK